MAQTLRARRAAVCAILLTRSVVEAQLLSFGALVQVVNK